ncbi:hypothetical protein AAHA92_20784 [Salvia divinorum]|uniref:C2 domain-containing protein n=1 Tax=Salvia divinorum TaxID=28513 RepID=A0ABD1GIB1_SALDI
MECRKLGITVVSAHNLPDVRSLGQMKVYAKISLKGTSKAAVKTPVDIEGDTNPRWNFAVDYTVSESKVQGHGLNLVVKLMCKRTLGDRLVGEVKIPVKDLFQMGLKSQSVLSYPVAGTREGRLDLMYSFSERMLARRPWKTALDTVGFLVLVGGALLLGGDTDAGDEDEDPKPHVEVHDGDVFYDAS